MRIATWNVSNATEERASVAGEALREHGVDIVLLQEVNPGSFEDLKTAAGFEWGVHVSESLGPMLDGLGRSGTRCAAIAGRSSSLLASASFPDFHLPEKALAAWVECAGARVTLLDYHAPHGGHRHLKPDQAVRAARWLARQRGPVILGGDFNTPMRDPIDPARIRTHWNTGDDGMGSLLGDDVLVGARPIHGLTDAYRSLLADQPAIAEGIDPDGPLATTIVVQDGPMRYDQIWVSDHFDVVDVVHDNSVLRTKSNPSARFDHALVVAELTLRDSA